MSLSKWISNLGSALMMACDFLANRGQRLRAAWSYVVILTKTVILGGTWETYMSSAPPLTDDVAYTEDIHRG